MKAISVKFQIGPVFRKISGLEKPQLKLKILLNQLVSKDLYFISFSFSQAFLKIMPKTIIDDIAQ